MTSINNGSDHVVEPTDEKRFEKALSSLLRRARENGVDIGGGWAPITGTHGTQWDVLITRIAEASQVTASPDTGGEPHELGQCTDCGKVYPVQVEREIEFRPIGVDHECACGNDEFIAYYEE